jgi:nicotinate-nucleotide adenylyltransferase
MRPTPLWTSAPTASPSARDNNFRTAASAAVNYLLYGKKYDIICDDAEQNTPSLLHAKTGAALARDRFGVPDAVYEAIRWHTTGKPDMTLLEKIIYLADYIEPTRKYEGCKRLREKFFSLCEKAKGNDDLRYAIDRVILDSIEETLSHLEEKGGKICPELFEAKDYLDKNCVADEYVRKDL